MSHIHIDVNDLTFSYNKNNQVLSGIDFHVSEDESVGIIGANGAGKSTFLKILVGLELNFGGEIRIEEMPLNKQLLPKIREKIGYVFQDSDSQLFMTTVEEDVAFAPRNYGLPEEEVERRVSAALEQVHISHLRKKSIYQLSGGEKKLCSLATILSMTPDMIFLDEPSAALDPRNRRNLIKILNEFEHVKLITSHDLDFIWDTCKRTVLMAEGRLIYDGPTDDIMRNETLLLENGLELPLSLQQR